MRRTILYLTALIAVFVSCSKSEKTYKIAVSQCSEDIWRDKLNNELKIGTYFHDGVELRFASADDSDEKQIEQIHQFVNDGIDLLIVAPNQVATVSPAIDEVFDKGIPVIVFDRKTNSEKFTAYIGADNFEMGRLMGEYIATRLNGKGRVLEIMGLKGSSPAIERHNGFESALKAYPNITLVASLQGDWTEESAVNAIKSYAGDLSNLDFVFGQNDRMAVGASKALSSKDTKYCGIDGLPGEGNGIACVRDSLLEASYIYPTHGDEVLQLAMNILEGKPYQKDNPLMAALVTRDNANVLLLQNEEMVRQGNNLDQLHQRSDAYLQQLGNQRIVLILAAAFIFLLLILLVIIYRYHLQKARIAEERTQMEREQLDFYTQVSHELRTPLTLIEGPLAQLAETKDIQEAGAEASGLFAIIRRNTDQLTQLINKMLNVQVTGSVAFNTDNVEIAATPQSDLMMETDTQQENATVLIVDDNADIRAYLRTILQDKYQVNEAADGQQGLAIANEIVPDLIVSDVMMPVMNGLEFCQRVKSGTATSHIPVILLTARALSQHQIEGYESGADAYITKPFSADVLLARIGNLLKSRLILKNLFGAVSNSDKEDTIETPQVILKEDTFLIKFRDFIEKNLADSDLSVETIGAELGLSRVQLYRKVKALTGQSPVELLRTARLQKGRELLQTTGKNVSEVAYEVGFTAPSYFTKCFKDEFGVSPSDL
ncbi:MAG: substrate-binding domain-containing protein [Prevotella sp.]|nr:substrate-binding domain-containing protein [Prevotella sp.]